MSVTYEVSQHRRWRAPQEDGSVFCDPPPAAIGAVLDENLQRRNDGSSPEAQALAGYDC
nr:hypothetical protein [Planctomycetales bacterium]